MEKSKVAERVVLDVSPDDSIGNEDRRETKNAGERGLSMALLSERKVFDAIASPAPKTEGQLRRQGQGQDRTGQVVFDSLRLRMTS